MTQTKRILFIILIMGSITLIPWLSINLFSTCDEAWDNVHGIDIAQQCLTMQSEWGVLNNEYFLYPLVDSVWKPGFSPIIFWAGVGIGILFLILMIFPKVFGFRDEPVEMPKYKPGAKGFPFWFWIGVPLHLLGWAGTFQVSNYFIELTHFLLLPLWWGYILMLDGIVYYRTGGESIIAVRPRSLFALAMTSFSGWLFYEYYNALIKGNWWYPPGEEITSTAFTAYAFAGAAAFWPQIFEVHSLLNSFAFFRKRWTFGKKMAMSPGVKLFIIAVCFLILALTPHFPYILFWSVWVTPMLIIMIGLSLLKIWTPLSPIAKEGNWRPLILIALSGMIMGAHWEFWNHASFKAIESRDDANNVAGLVDYAEKPFTFVFRDSQTTDLSDPVYLTEWNYYSYENTAEGWVEYDKNDSELRGGPHGLCQMQLPSLVRSLAFERDEISKLYGLKDGFVGVQHKGKSLVTYDDGQIQALGGPDAAFKKGINIYKEFDCDLVAQKQAQDPRYYLGSGGWRVMESQNPPLWIYSIPYLDAYHLPGAEMPFLGYLGYLPFGIYAWVWWIILGYLLGFPLKITLHEDDDNHHLTDESDPDHPSASMRP